MGKRVDRYGEPHFQVEDEDVVSIWAAAVPLSKIPADYFEENYDDERPLNHFCEEFGFGTYDHDFVDTNASENGPADIRELLAACSYGTSFADAAAAAAEKLGLARTEYVILLYNFRYEPKVTRVRKTSHLAFIGCFPFDSDAATAE